MYTESILFIDIIDMVNAWSEPEFARPDRSRATKDLTYKSNKEMMDDIICLVVNAC